MIAIGVLDDRQHDVVVAAVEMIAGADRELALVRLGARLAETLGELVGVEAHEIADLAAFDQPTLSQARADLASLVNSQRAARRNWLAISP